MNMVSKLGRVTLFIITILFASCSDDFFSASSNGETTVTFTFYTTDEDDPSGKTTRAIDSSNESTVNDITVFIFDSNGNNIGYGYSDSETTSIKIITRQATNCKVYALANIRDVMGASAISEIATESQLIQKTHSLTSADNLTDNTNSLIMTGVITGFNTNTSTKNITLTRLAAKFTFNIKVPLGMDIASYQICSTPTGSQLISNNTKWNGSYGNLSTTTPTYANYKATTITFTKYLYENLAGNGNNSSTSGMAGRTEANAPTNATYININTHNYNSSSTYTTYRVYLGGPTLLNSGSTSGYNNYDIKRNTHYTVTIDLRQKAPNVVYNYDYTASIASFTPPISGTYKIECWGAQGTDWPAMTSFVDPKNGATVALDGRGYYGGRGAYCKGDLNMTPSEIIYICVGASKGGYNGGGVEVDRGGTFGTDGGGATDIRLDYGSGNWQNFNGLKSRIMVAAGGGGANHRSRVEETPWYGAGHGGAGGALNGFSGTRDDAAMQERYPVNKTMTYGATQTTGGTYTNQVNENGSWSTEVEVGWRGCFGFASQENVGNGIQTGGGSGYYGGANSTHCGGSSGSSFISGYTGCDAIDASSIETNIVHTGQPIHYSRKQFSNMTMTAGNASMPTPAGGTETGHSGNGYARITFISAN